MLTFRHLLIDAQNQLATALGLPVAEARIEVQVLMRRALGDVSRAWLISHDNEVPTSVQSALFGTMLRRRLGGEPVAYILGEREFYGLTFSVSPEVLIPRPDTETLVESALARISANRPCRVLDLGTGSGAIAIAIAVNRPQARVTGIDRSDKAVQVARKNAHHLRADNADFMVSNWFLTVGDAVYDVIVSNPPYIEANDPHLSQGDLRFEPVAALAAGPDGLDDLRHIIQSSPKHLLPGGWLMLEHGCDQTERVTQLLREAGFSEVDAVADLAGILRVALGRKAD